MLSAYGNAAGQEELSLASKLWEKKPSMATLTKPAPATPPAGALFYWAHNSTQPYRVACLSQKAGQQRQATSNANGNACAVPLWGTREPYIDNLLVLLAAGCATDGFSFMAALLGSRPNPSGVY